MDKIDVRIEKIVRHNILELDCDKIFECSEEEVIDMLKTIEQYGFINIDYTTLLINSILKNYIKVLKLLLCHEQVDPSDWDNYAIICASENGYTEAVKELLKDSRVDPSVDDNYAIKNAQKNGHKEIVKLIKEAIKNKKMK